PGQEVGGLAGDVGAGAVHIHVVIEAGVAQPAACTGGDVPRAGIDALVLRVHADFFGRVDALPLLVVAGGLVVEGLVPERAAAGI
ncbi:hypothetical protein B8W90_12680, partial [Staphylococcus hominis]